MNIAVINAQLVDAGGQLMWMLAADVEGRDGLSVLVLPADSAEWQAAQLTEDEADDREVWTRAILTTCPGATTVSGPRGRKPIKAAGATMTVLADSDCADPLEFIVAECPRRPEHVEARRELLRARDEAERSERPAADSDSVILASARRVRQNREAI